jgi:hypothetical protein
MRRRFLVEPVYVYISSAHLYNANHSALRNELLNQFKTAAANSEKHGIGCDYFITFTPYCKCTLMVGYTFMLLITSLLFPAIFIGRWIVGNRL